MKITVNGYWVAIDEAAPDTTTAGGIIIPEKAQKPYPYGSIVGIGAKCETATKSVGDVTIFDIGMKNSLIHPVTKKELLSMLHEDALFVTMDPNYAEAAGFIVSHKTIHDCMGVTMAPPVLVA